MALARGELDDLAMLPSSEYAGRLETGNFIDALAALQQQQLAGVLPDFLAPAKNLFARVSVPELDSIPFQFHLAWNPRLLRLNPHVTRTRDWLARALTP